MNEEQARFRALQLALRGRYLGGIDDIIMRADRYAKFIMKGQEPEEDK